MSNPDVFGFDESIEERPNPLRQSNSCLLSSRRPAQRFLQQTGGASLLMNRHPVISAIPSFR